MASPWAEEGKACLEAGKGELYRPWALNQPGVPWASRDELLQPGVRALGLGRAGQVTGQNWGLCLGLRGGC